MSKRRAIHGHYVPRISPDRAGFDVVDWADGPSQRRRFEVLTDRVELEGKSLLDVGCGLGDLCDYLAGLHLSAEYTGVDIVEPMVAEARRRHPGVRFECGDIFGTNPFCHQCFDVVFCSGTFNLDLGNNTRFFAGALPRLFELAGQYVVFNLLHRRTEQRYDHCVYYDPDVVEALLAPFDCQILVVDDYLPNDFSVICRIRQR